MTEWTEQSVRECYGGCCCIGGGGAEFDWDEYQYLCDTLPEWDAGD